MELISKVAVAVGGGVAAMGDSVAQRDYYLALALELLARADGESDPEKRAGFEALAASYRLTAEQAPHEAGLIIDVELPIEETKPRGPDPLQNSTRRVARLSGAAFYILKARVRIPLGAAAGDTTTYGSGHKSKT